MMNKVFKVVVVLPALLFVFIGLRFLFDPAGAVAELGMPLLDGIGRSTQIGDLSAFFITGGLCVLIAVYTGRRTWYYPAIMLLGLTAIGRTLAWLVHGADFATQSIAVEVIVSALLIAASVKLADKD